MIYFSFALRWYMMKLQTHPIVANLSSALVLMTAGDVMAQKIEIMSMEEDENDHGNAMSASQDNQSPHSTVHLPNQHVVLAASSASPIEQQQQQQHATTSTIHLGRYHGNNSHDKLSDKLIRRRLVERQESNDDASEDDNSKATTLQAITGSSSMSDDFSSTMLQAIQKFHDNEISNLDYFRTGTMVVWSVTAYTPFYIGLYKLYDRYLPKHTTPLTIATRVGLSFLASMPVNAAFYCYGSFVHHITDWASMVQQQQRETSKDLSWVESVRSVPLDWDRAVIHARDKLQTEFWNTVSTSASVWIPINMFNFTFMPCHLRPLTLMVCSAGWNCYLSLAQHRNNNV